MIIFFHQRAPNNTNRNSMDIIYIRLAIYRNEQFVPKWNNFTTSSYIMNWVCCYYSGCAQFKGFKNTIISWKTQNELKSMEWKWSILIANGIRSATKSFLYQQKAQNSRHKTMIFDCENYNNKNDRDVRYFCSLYNCNNDFAYVNLCALCMV